MILDHDYAEWFASADNRLAARAALAEGDASVALRILQPKPGTVCFLNEDLPESVQRLLLKASTPCRWSSDTLPLDRSRPGGVEARLIPGRHQLRATSPDGAIHAETWIEVRRM